MTIISGGKLNNSSFDNGGQNILNQKKIKIPKLNL